MIFERKWTQICSRRDQFTKYRWVSEIKTSEGLDEKAKNLSKISPKLIEDGDILCRHKRTDTTAKFFQKTTNV